MGIKICLSSLSEEHQRLIFNTLKFKPYNPAFEGMKLNPKFASRFKFIREDEEKTITLYEINKINDIITLPFYFGCCLTGSIHNMNKDHLKIEQKFNGELYPHQIPIVNESLDYLSQYNTTTIGVPPATGKTNMSIYIGLKLELMMLIVIPSKVLIKSWVNTLMLRSPNLYDYLWIVGVNDKFFYRKKDNDVEWFFMHER